MRDGFVRVAAITPNVFVADVQRNAEEIKKAIVKAAEEKAVSAVFPQLSITASTCGDLFFTDTLINGAKTALLELVEETEKLDILCAVGLPVKFNGNLYNCAAIFKNGSILGFQTKTSLPISEKRYFSVLSGVHEIDFGEHRTFIGTDIIFTCENVDGLKIGAELGEDLYSPCPPSVKLAERGASLVLNLSCTNEIVGRAEKRRTKLTAYSEQIAAAYVLAEGGVGESTTDFVFAGHNIIAENGNILAESELFENGITIAEVDVQKIMTAKRKNVTFGGNVNLDIKQIEFSYDENTIENFVSERVFPKFPFVPEDKQARDTRCAEILKMQAAALASRIRHVGAKSIVVGVSGGLDSTLVMLASAEAFDMLGLSRKGIMAISMPCFGTTGRTKSNAEKISEGIGAEFREISIEKAVTQHFKDIGHNADNFNVTFENAQARERTQVLMDIANDCNALVIGTGDLSELALGWATFNGDHMSMYGVNASVPKTLIRHIVGYCAENSSDKLKAALFDVLDTPVSPELLPPKDGEISQKTEDIVGPYELHDFFMYYFVRWGFSPAKIYRIAVRIFKGEYSAETIKKWLTVFVRRFFSQQFKRSCSVDGPKLGSVSLSPRGDFVMPSDAHSKLWLDELDNL